VSIFYFIGILFKPHPTLLDISFGMALLVCSPRSIARMNVGSVVALAALPVNVSLFVVDHWLWLETGSGNANYIYFQCLALNVFLFCILKDFVDATLQRDKALRLTRKTLK